MSWERLEGFGEFEGSGADYHIPVTIDEASISNIISSLLSFVSQHPGYEDYRFRKNQIAHAHCSNCEPINEWVLEGLKNE